jgi:hypothetical protein
MVNDGQASGRCLHVTVLCGTRTRTDLREDVLLDGVAHGISFELFLEICFRAIARIAEELHQCTLGCIAHMFVRVLQAGDDGSDVAFEGHSLLIVHADDPSYSGLLLPRVGSSQRLLSNYALDVAAQVWVDVSHGLAGACSQWFPEIAEALLEHRKDARDELLDGVAAGILNAESLNEVAECGEGRGREVCGSLLGDGELEALEDGRLGALGHAIVLDVGLEAVEGVDLGVGVDGGPLEVAQQSGRLLVHGCRCLPLSMRERKRVGFTFTRGGELCRERCVVGWVLLVHVAWFVCRKSRSG